jgi:3-oxoacyl-[acyl-carrier-protein] synthase-3
MTAVVRVARFSQTVRAFFFLLANPVRQVQAAIGATGALAFDVTAACSGFVVGMVNGVHFIRGGEYKNVLVIGADVLSRYVDWRDRGTCILFGDGCGAMVLTATDKPEDCCLLGFDMHSDGRAGTFLTTLFCKLFCKSQHRSTDDSRYGPRNQSDTPPGVSATLRDGTGNHNLTAKFVNEAGTETEGAAKPTAEGALAASGKGAFCNISMNGQDVFKFAVRAVPDTVGKSLARAELEAADIDHLVLHQANQRIIDGAAKKLGLGKGGEGDPGGV